MGLTLPGGYARLYDPNRNDANGDPLLIADLAKVGVQRVEFQSASDQSFKIVLYADWGSAVFDKDGNWISGDKPPVPPPAAASQKRSQKLGRLSQELSEPLFDGLSK